jgi:hypothetical protein
MLARGGKAIRDFTIHKRALDRYGVATWSVAFVT